MLHNSDSVLCMYNNRCIYRDEEWLCVFSTYIGEVIIALARQLVGHFQ